MSIAAEQALRAANSCGSEPVGVERPLAESSRSQQDWRAILRDFVAATAPADYRWTPPNRRYIASGLYLPSVKRQGVGELVIAVDTSGSIGKLELEQFAGEISAIADEVQPEGVHVVYCDAAVRMGRRECYHACLLHLPDPGTAGYPFTRRKQHRHLTWLSNA